MNWLQNVFSGRDLTNQGCFNENSGGGGLEQVKVSVITRINTILQLI